MTGLTTAVAERVADLRTRIAAAGGDVERIRIIAVTKGHGIDAIVAAVDAGVHDIGENYGPELLTKANDLAAEVLAPIRWHHLGEVQRNKVPSLAPHVSYWHGVDRVEEAEAIGRRSPGALVLVQVNVSGLSGRPGCSFDATEALVDGIRASADAAEVVGLMAVGPPGGPDAARPLFRRLGTLAADLELPELSIGMSGDLEVAVQEGATIVRVGTAIFGERPRSQPSRR